jgi:phosphoglycolate phosphatase-like HAD superfamily hydrolase
VPSLVLFDIDGTLLRGAGPHHKTALIEGIRRATGITTHLDGVATAGMLDGDLMTAMLRASGETDEEIERVLEQAMQACETAYCADCPSDLRSFVCPGVPEALAALRDQNAVLGVVTGNLSQIGWRKLELTGLREFFTVGAFAQDGKTRAELARIAAERAAETSGISRFTRTSLVGDHANDVMAAKANGFQSVAVATGVASREDLGRSRPDVLVNDLRELDLNLLL